MKTFIPGKDLRDFRIESVGSLVSSDRYAYIKKSYLVKHNGRVIAENIDRKADAERFVRWIVRTNK